MDKYLIDGHKLYWNLDRVVEWQRKRIIPPIYIEVSPVSYCNHKCLFCGVDFAMQKTMRLDTKVFCEKLKQMGLLGVRSIMYAGEGEPLLHKDLPKFVKTTKESGIDVSITTNGTTGTLELWEEILPHLAWIKFSVDAGTPKTYAKVHNVPAAIFDKTLDSIQNAIKVKNDNHLNVTIGVQFLVIEENLRDVSEAINLFSNLGVDYLVFKPYSLHPQMIKKKDILYTEDMVQYLKDTINEYKDKVKMEIIFRKNAMEKYIQKEKPFNHCYALPFWGYISAKGDFYTCSIFLGDERFRAGNVYENDMEKILLGKEREKSIEFGEKDLYIDDKCRVNCRMARINEFLEFLENKPMHINFV